MGGYNERIAPYLHPVLIYNPTAGAIRHNPERILQRTTAALDRANLTPIVMSTMAAGDATRLGREALASGADLVMVLGGDGTINEVVNALAGTGVAMAVLPGGTANCLAIEIDLGKNVERAIARLTNYRAREVALGSVLGPGGRHYFLSMCGVGLDAHIVLDTDPKLKRSTGKFAYWVAGLGHLVRTIENLELSIGEQTYRAGFLLASRIRNYGGDLEIARGASLTSCDFEFVLFEGSNPMRYAGYMLGVAARQVQRMPGVHVIRGVRAEVLTPAHVQIDGEYWGRGTAVIEIAPVKLKLLLPAASHS
jgi:diacylglycerol kinase (ATP)